MHSLFQSLLTMHGRQLTPLSCAPQTVEQIHRYFEDVVLENNLTALVVAGLPLQPQRAMKSVARVRRMGQSAYRAFYFVQPEDGLTKAAINSPGLMLNPMLLKSAKHSGGATNENFLVIADSRFSALLATAQTSATDEIGLSAIWTFEPDVVYSALEYLLARVTAEHPHCAPFFSSAVRACTPKATSMQLAVSVTTKLARVMQEQAGREVAINRIANAARDALDMDAILQTTVREVGGALKVECCALRVTAVEGEPKTKYHLRRAAFDALEEAELHADLDAYAARSALRHQVTIVDGEQSAGGEDLHPLAVVPVIYHDEMLGILFVRADDAGRAWDESEILLLKTVANQVAITISHARLFAQAQSQALTDPLTGCNNRRAFDAQLERELSTAARNADAPLALIVLDIDNFKLVNDTHGHETGDLALKELVRVLNVELRAGDTAARFGGEEFTIILPQTDLDGALVFAERLRQRLEKTVMPKIGCITASFGVAVHPVHAATREQLVEAADRALYQAKHEGRNRVCAAIEAAPSAPDGALPNTPFVPVAPDGLPA